MQKFQIVFTSDTHGCLFPSTDSIEAARQHPGLLGLWDPSSRDSNTILIDGGDAIQGSPLTYYAHRYAVTPNPVATAMNLRGTDVVTLGNHDFNYGLDYLKAYLDGLDAVCVCANIRDRAGRLPIQDSVIRTLENGLRVGIAGVCTDYIVHWCGKELLDELIVTDPLEAARRALADLKPLCDVSILVYHGGCEKDLTTEQLLTDSTENQACRIAETLDYDILLTGHQHGQIEGIRYHGSWIVQPGSHAQMYSHLQVEYVEGESRVRSALCTPVSPFPFPVDQQLQDVQRRAEAWLDLPLGRLDRPLRAEPQPEMALHGSLLANLINTVQIEATGADISATCLGNRMIELTPTVTVRSIMTAYEFSNTLTLLEMTGAQLKTYLECSAAFFTLEGGRVRVSDAFIVPKIEFYNYDYFSGIDYTMDLNRDIGKRIIEITRHGRAVLLTETFTVCVTNYRASGTGIYAPLRNCRVLKTFDTEVPELLMEYVERHRSVKVDTHHSLHILPYTAEQRIDNATPVVAAN